ncbi:MAG: alpha/beta fold hydrolase [Pyramidobacter sp.]
MKVPLLLLPGLTGGADCWGAAFLSALKKGGTEPLLYEPPQDYSFDGAVASASRQIEERGKTCAVLGWSMGADVALRLALKRPELVSSLVLCSACADQASLARRSDVQRRLLNDPWPHWYRLLMQAVMPLSSRARPAAAENFMRLMTQKAQNDALRWNAQREALKAAPSVMEDLPRLRVPTLVCSGTEDMLFPPDEGRKIAARMPRARFRLFDAGHAIMYDRPKELAEAVTGFLAERSAERTIEAL